MDKLFRIINYLGLNYDNNILSTSITATKEMFLSNNDKNKNIHNDDTLLKITQIKSDKKIKVEQIKSDTQIKVEQIKLEQIKIDTQIKLEQIKVENIKYEDCMKYEKKFDYCYNLFK